jgi:hypothetical protein
MPAFAFVYRVCQIHILVVVEEDPGRRRIAWGGGIDAALGFAETKSWRSWEVGDKQEGSCDVGNYKILVVVKWRNADPGSECLGTEPFCQQLGNVDLEVQLHDKNNL